MKLYCVILDLSTKLQYSSYQDLSTLSEIIPELFIIVNGTDFDKEKEPIIFGSEEGFDKWFFLHRDKEIVEDYISNSIARMVQKYDITLTS